MIENSRLKERERDKNKMYTIRAEYFKLSDPLARCEYKKITN